MIRRLWVQKPQDHQAVDSGALSEALLPRTAQICVCSLSNHVPLTRFVCFLLQADEGPEQEGGHSETQGAGGEEPECPVDGGGPKARG